MLKALLMGAALVTVGCSGEQRPVGPPPPQSAVRVDFDPARDLSAVLVTGDTLEIVGSSHITGRVLQLAGDSVHLRLTHAQTARGTSNLAPSGSTAWVRLDQGAALTLISTPRFPRR